MPDIKFSCPSCEGHILTDLSAAGQTVPCPHCSASIIIPSTAPLPQQSRGANNKTCAKRLPCPQCGASVSLDVMCCSSCNWHPDDFLRDNQYLRITEGSCGPLNVPDKLGPKASWWQLLIDGTALVCLPVSNIRCLLLNGYINRFTLCRKITHPPAERKDATPEVVRVAYEQWQRDMAWRRVGDLLVNDEEEIQSLYDPVKAKTRGWATGAYGLLALIATITLYVLMFTPKGWRFSTEIFAHTYRNAPATAFFSTEVMKPFSGFHALAMILIGLAFPAIAGLLIGFLAYPWGAALGFVVGSLRKASLPRAPADNYPVPPKWNVSRGAMITSLIMHCSVFGTLYFK